LPVRIVDLQRLSTADTVFLTIKIDASSLQAGA
jgi:hypothetical protein